MDKHAPSSSKALNSTNLVILTAPTVAGLEIRRVCCRQYSIWYCRTVVLHIAHVLKARGAIVAIIDSLL